jgi:hypothetical protein
MNKNFFVRVFTRSSFFLYISLYASAILLINFFVGFHQTHNDFWDIYFGIRHLALSDPHSLYSPYFPMGYFLLLKLIAGHFPPEIPAIMVNVIFGFVFFAASAILYNNILNRKTALWGIVFLSLYPRVFYYMQVGGADPASMTFFALGILVIINCLVQNVNSKNTIMFVGGLFMGCAAIFRYHALAGSCMLLFSLFVVYRKEWPGLLFAGIGTFVVFLPQLILYLITPPHTVHFAIMNIYNLMYPLSWYHTITLSLPSSALQLIAGDPLLFIKKYAAGVWQHALVFAPPVLAVVFVKDSQKKRLCVALALFCVIYSLFFGAMTSNRSLLLPLSISFLCAGMLAEEAVCFISKRMHRKISLVLICSFIILTLCAFLMNDASKVAMRHKEHRVCLLVENYLHEKGCKNVRQIFSTDFYLYFRSMPPCISYFNGGAPRWETYLYNKEYPEFSDSTIKDFSDACHKRQVRFVILTEPCRERSQVLGSLFDNPQSSSDFVFLKEIDRFRIFEVR